MEILLVLRAAWRRRRLVAGAVASAVIVFVGLHGMSPATTTSAVAWTRVALDTPRSQLLAVAPTGSESLIWRASLIEHLMATDASTRELASRLGVPANQVLVVDNDLVNPLVATTIANAATLAAGRAMAPYTLTVFLQNTSMPVISIEAAGPTRAGADRLAGAAVAVLSAQGSAPGVFASQVHTNGEQSTLQPFEVVPIAPVRETVLSSSKLPLKALGAAFFVFMLCIVVGRRVTRRRGGHGESRRPSPRMRAAGMARRTA